MRGKKMKQRIFILGSTWILTGALAVFLQGQPQNPPTQAEDSAPVLTVPKDYHYNSHGRRDPFVNPVPKPKTATAAAPPQITRPPGLKGVMVTEAQIAGVVTSREPSMNVVIISAPGAKAPYFARVGDELFDAVVKSIKMDKVTFAMTASAAEPNRPREIVRKVRPSPGEEK
jgi:hypothetical protein